MGKRKKNPEITHATLLQRDPEQDFSYIDGEVVMLSLRNGEYYGLDAVGTRIWELLEQPVRFSFLIDNLMEEFEVERGICEKDTREYLETLLARQLLREVE